jgi:uncharacterized iron-regulated protein
MPSFLIFLALFMGNSPFARALDCRDGRTGGAVPLEDIVGSLEPGSILILGELHGFADVAQGQLEVLRGLRSAGHKIDVAMEFFPYQQQDLVDRFISGELTEPQFLADLGWGKSMSFDYYRGQVLFPQPHLEERTLAINAPRTLTGVIAKKGLAGLTPEEQQLLPPEFTLGRTEYFDRFRDFMGGHVDEAALGRYFEAQSVWDDTMAWQLLVKRSSNTQVVVVGEFHVQYGGGLPDRLRSRDSGRSLTTIGFVNSHQLTSEELASEIGPHPRWGVRENFICLVDLPSDPLFGGAPIFLLQ